MDIVGVLLNVAVTRKVILENDWCSAVLLHVLIIDDGPLCDKCALQLIFIVSNLNDDECVDRWNEMFFKESKEKYKFEKLVSLLDSTMNYQVAESLMFFINYAVKSHISLFTRKRVEVIPFIDMQFRNIFIDWDIIGVMDRVIQRSHENNWPNTKKLLEEYTIFTKDEENDRQEAIKDGVDISDANAIFSSLPIILVRDRFDPKETCVATSWRCSYTCVAKYVYHSGG